MATSGTILRKFFWNTFDHLGASVVLNVLWVILCTPWLAGGYLLTRLLTTWLGAVGLVSGLIASFAGVWLASPSLGLLSIASKWVKYQSPNKSQMWGMFRNRMWMGLWLGGVAAFLAVLFGVNSAFYLRLTEPWTWVGLILAGVMLWMQIALLSIALHLGLELARDQDASFRHAGRRAVALALALPVQSILLGVFVAAVGIALSLTSVGLPLIAMSICAILASTVHRELLKRFRSPVPGQEQADRLEEVRSIRDLLKPWDMHR